MPKQILSYSTKQKITKLMWSNDWFSLTPWAHEGKTVPYIHFQTEHKSDNVTLKYSYIGPFAVLSGTWIPEEDMEQA